MSARLQVAEGLSPRDAIAHVDLIDRAWLRLQQATRDLSRAYDAELARCYPDLGPAWMPMKREGSVEELARARSEWQVALSELLEAVSEPVKTSEPGGRS